MTPWRFEGASNREQRKFPIVPLAAVLFRRRRSGRCGGGRRRRRRRAGGTAGGRRRRGWRGGRCRRLRLGRGIDPAGMNAAVERLGYFGINLAAKAGQAAGGWL